LLSASLLLSLLVGVVQHERKHELWIAIAWRRSRSGARQTAERCTSTNSYFAFFFLHEMFEVIFGALPGDLERRVPP
jgi:hypothetical protein